MTVTSTTVKQVTADDVKVAMDELEVANEKLNSLESQYNTISRERTSYINMVNNLQKKFDKVVEEYKKVSANHGTDWMRSR